ncbi:MAG: DUF493 family protein [Cyclobacteriaceae bacterium]
MSWDIEAFREKVESQHSFPGNYNFKFIVPKDKKGEIMAILPAAEISFKESSNGNYVSITAAAHLQNSQEVLDVYVAAHKIQGAIAL